MMSLYSARVGKLVRTKQAIHHAREVAMIVLDALDQRGVALDKGTVDVLVAALTKYFETWPTR